MSFNTRINRVKISLFFLFFISFYLPVYSDKVNNTVYKVSISNLNAGTFFVIFFLILMIATVVLYFVKEQYFKWAYLATTSFMGILLFMLLFLKQDGSVLRLGFYLEVVFVGMLVLAYFSEELTFKVLDKLKEWLIALYQFLKKYILIGYTKIKTKIQNRKQKDETNEEGTKDEETL